MDKGNILVVEDDPGYQVLYRRALEPTGYNLQIERDPKSGLEAVRRHPPDLILLDLTFFNTPQAGLSFIEEALGQWPDLSIVVISAQEESSVIMKALDLGAMDYVVKDVSLYDLLPFRVAQALKRARLEKQNKMQVESNNGFVFGAEKMIVGKSPKMSKVYELIESVAWNRSTVLVLGESGTGKELIAQAIHGRKGLTNGPFVSIDCGSVPKPLLESELFGVMAEYPGFHNKERLIGKLEAAGEGTLLLDEIGNMELDLQTSLLRVLEEREFTPLGCREALPLRSQVIASTNANLETAIRSGKFREDLYYRLNEVPIVVPPLRERKEDIPLLVRSFLKQYEGLTQKRVEILPEAMQKLMDYSWPGNVRELAKSVQRALTLCRAQYLTPKHLDLGSCSPQKTDTYQESITDRDPVPETDGGSHSITVSLGSSGIPPLDQFTQEARKAYAQHILDQVNGNHSMASSLLAVDIRTLRRVLSRIP